jgi:TatD DNase family protein
LPFGSEIDAMLVDVHCHFDFPQFDGQRKQLMNELRGQGIGGLVIPGVRCAGWLKIQQIAMAHSGIFYCLGIHPWYINEHGPEDLRRLRDHLANASEQCVGIGECGLDRLRGSLSEQAPWFEAQVKIAAEYQRALVIHSVKANDEVIRVLKVANWTGNALIHGFSGSYEQAVKLIDLGCMLGVGGVITHVKSGKTRDTLTRVPASALVLETDAPERAPAGAWQGQNFPQYLPGILRELALLRGVGEPELAAILLENSYRLYGSALQAELCGLQLDDYRN